MSGETDLRFLLKRMDPAVRDGEFVFVSLDTLPSGVTGDALPSGVSIDEMEAIVREDEGVTLVVRRDIADAHDWPYDFVAGWITLRVHSDLAAVGLTAAFSAALAEHQISCNVIAGFWHDHLLVPVDQLDTALEALRALTSDGGES